MPTSSEVLRTDGPLQTEALGARIAESLRAGDVVLVSGDLGAGKTTLVRGAVRALGHHGRVASPTFTIARRYDGGRVPVSHLDLFRLAGGAEEDPSLLADELAPDRIAFVEWPEAAARELAGVRIARRVALHHDGGDRRRIEIDRP